MIYNLLAINIDGTLLKSNGKLTKATKEAIDYVKDKDVYVTLVTSRNFPSAKKVAKALKLETPLITHGGAFISDSLEEPLFDSRLTAQKTFDIVKVLETFDCNVRLLHENFSLGNRVKQKNNIMAKAILGTSDPLFYPMQFVDSLSDHLVDEPISAPKIDVYFTDTDERDHVKDTIQSAFEDVHVVTVNEKALEILPQGISKLSGLKKLGEKLDISLDKMVVIGDSYNDVEMITHAGLGVAMGNAPIEVKRAADWVTRSNEQNGVSYMVKEHFRKQQRVRFLREISK